MSRAAFDALLASVGQLFAERPVLSDFAPFPSELEWADLPPFHREAADLVQAWEVDGAGPEDAVHRAAQAVAPFADWRCSYTEDDVGAVFLANYGFIELYGPTGHYHCENARGFVAYWGQGLYYDWHVHAAEELYFVLSGEALFRSEGMPDVVLTRGETRLHKSWQPHAMETQSAPILVFVPWRGAALGAPPQMQAKSN